MLVEALHIPSTFSTLSLVFKGSPSSPFLAPRGIWLVNNKLCVSDTGQNRVFIWDRLPEAEYESPSIVLGQEEEMNTGRNGNHQISASTLQYPSGIWSDGDKLIVADAWNHRVLIWNQWPTATGQPADTVIGQKNFTSNLPNTSGVGAACDERTLYWPYGVHSDGKRLWVADTGNRRVLYYENIPEVNFAAADDVIGKPDFKTRDFEPDEPIWPYSVRIHPNGYLAITDTQYFRVLLWKDWDRARSGLPPDQVIGQPDLASNGQNQFGLIPNEHSLNWCYDSFFYKSGLMVMDTANSRLKWHEAIFEGCNPPAVGLMGQPDFSMSSENIVNIDNTERTLYWPFSICIDEDRLAIADTGNHRIILNNMTK